jgi:hypothetical protein
MRSPSTLTTAQVLDVFTAEVAAYDGRVTDTFHDGRRLFTRSILPRVEEVRSGDRVQGGVALKATGDGVCLYPYVFRQVCRNGAILAESLAARSLEDLDVLEPETAVERIREGIATCSAPEVFRDNVRRMRTACERQADMALNLLPFLSRFSASIGPELLSRIMEQFFHEGDRSQFGLANAITAIARDTRDPDTRWNLEELGGGIAVGIIPRPPVDAGRAAWDRSGELVAVG